MGAAITGDGGEGRRRKNKGIDIHRRQGRNHVFKVGGPISWSGVLLPLSKKFGNAVRRSLLPPQDPYQKAT